VEKDARAALSKAEKDLGNPQNLILFEHGINLLAEVVTSDFKFKPIASRLAATYRIKAVSNVNKIIADSDSLSVDSFEHWTNVLKVFTDAGFDDDPGLKACNEKLAKTWVNRVVGNVSPWELEQWKRKSLTEK